MPDALGTPSFIDERGPATFFAYMASHLTTEGGLIANPSDHVRAREVLRIV